MRYLCEISGLAHYQQVLDSVTYSSTSADPTSSGSDTNRTISWVVNDGTLNSATQTTSLTLSTSANVSGTGTYTVQSTTTLTDPISGSPTVDVTNGATLDLGGGTNQTNSTISGTPAFDISSGSTLNIYDTINSGATITVVDNGTLNIYSNTNSGTSYTLILQGTGSATDSGNALNRASITVGGTDTLTLSGQVNNGATVTIEDSATVKVANINGTTTFYIEDNGTLEFQQSSSATVNFSPDSRTTPSTASSGWLKLDNSAAFTGVISGVVATNSATNYQNATKIDLVDFKFSNVQINPPSYSSSKDTTTLTLTNSNNQSVTLTISGNHTTWYSGSDASVDGNSSTATGTFIWDPPATTLIASTTDPATATLNATTDPTAAPSTLTATETAGNQTNLASVTVDPGTVVALNLAVSGADGSGNDATSVTIAGLPSDVALTNAAGDALHAANGSITLTQAELAGLALHTSTQPELITLSVNAANSADGWSATKSLVIDASAPATHWQSAASGDWATAASWTASGPGVPTSSEAAVIDASGAYTVSIDGAAVAQSLTINAAGATVVDSGSLTLGGALTVDAGTFELDNGNLQAAAIAIAAAGAFLIEQGNVTLAQPITNDGSWVVENNNTVVDVVGAVSGSGSLTVGAGATLEFGTVDHTIAGPLTDQGTVEVTDGKLEIAGTATGTGVLKIDAGATLQLDGADSVNVTFAGSTGELILNDPAHFTGTVAGATGSLTTGDKIDLTNIAYSNNDAYTLSYDKATNLTTLKVTDGSTTDTIKLAGDQTAATWNFSSDGHGGTIAVDPPASTVAGNHDSAQLPGQASWHEADHFNFSTDSAADHLASHTDHDVRPGSTSLASDPAALARHGEDQFVFNANFGHDSANEFHAENDATHTAQPSWQGVAEILSHAAEADHVAAVAHDQGHAFDWSHWQKDKAPTDFIVHG
jgi:hypothetical protein